jgi:hypothetical protein
MKYAFQMGSGGMMFKPRFMTIVLRIQVTLSLLPRQNEWGLVPLMWGIYEVSL